jgi:hypothetical protein
MASVKQARAPPPPPPPPGSQFYPNTEVIQLRDQFEQLVIKMTEHGKLQAQTNLLNQAEKASLERRIRKSKRAESNDWRIHEMLKQGQDAQNQLHLLRLEFGKEKKHRIYQDYVIMVLTIIVTLAVAYLTLHTHYEKPPPSIIAQLTIKVKQMLRDGRSLVAGK